MFLLEPIPDTTGYMIAGYAVAFIVMGLYVASLYIRNRNYRQDMSMLEEMEKPAEDVQAGPAGKPKKKAAKPAAKKHKK